MRTVSVACASSRDASRRTVAYLTSRDRGLRLLCLPRLAAAAAGARCAARVRRALPPLRPRPARRAGLDDVATTSSARGRRPRWARATGAALKSALERAGGYGGDFATVLASLRRANRADVVFSTVDTVGIPLMLLERGRAACGRRSSTSRSGFPSGSRGCARSACGASTRARSRPRRQSLAYSEHEADELRDWLAAYGESTRVEFVPFGVDERAFAPSTRQASVDVVIGRRRPASRRRALRSRSRRACRAARSGS